ncbi:MAG: DUF885 domain-containing protein [Bacteroidales bacterium]|nr:DUF885 domain-containing protein [Lachnoclostridium sp.]MCM1384712.1 DUF885 domain-containing protein [Lachnoclostridium sp.]MCM1465274.1 DUF885 domain-containing protein [Bacteroidales bacterium]
MKRRNVLNVRQLAAACILFLVFSCSTLFLFEYRSDEKRFSHISTQLFLDEMKGNTLNMHYTLACPENFGIYSYEPQLPCYSSESTLSAQAATENILASLEHIDAAKLPSKDKYAYQLLKRSLEHSLQMSYYAYYDEPLSPSSGMQSHLPILLAEYTFRGKQDVEDYLALLDQSDEYFASLLVYEQEKAAAGLLMAPSSLKKVINQCDTIVTSEELEQETHFLQTTFLERLQLLVDSGKLTESDAAAYRAQNNRLLRTVLLPAYENLADGLYVLMDENIPLRGLAAKPHGADYYCLLLASETGSYRDISQIKELLLRQFSREYEAIRKLVSEQSAMEKEQSPSIVSIFPYQSADVMLADLQNRMSKDFPGTDKVEVTLKTVSPNLEEYCAPAFYLTTPIDDTNRNTIYINRRNSPDELELYTTLAHEGYPGHLYQTVYHNKSLMSGNDNIVRQLLSYGGYLEGWALYVEFIAYDYAADIYREQGLTKEAVLASLESHSRSLQLCLYSLLDIMIHYENASYNQVAEVLGKFGISNSASVKAIYSYITEEPCNYLKYYLGYLELLELKESAKSLWGEDYSDYRFHTFYLECGPSDFTSLQEQLSETANLVDKRYSRFYTFYGLNRLLTAA